MLYPDFEPHSVTTVFSSQKPKVKKIEKDEKQSDSDDKPENPIQPAYRSVNEMGIQMISQQLFQQIFKNSKVNSVDSNLVEK